MKIPDVATRQRDALDRLLVILRSTREALQREREDLARAILEAENLVEELRKTNGEPS